MKTRLKKNTTAVLEAEDLSDQGFGVARLNGKTVFVKDLLPGEKAEARIIKDLSSYAIAKVENRLNTSPHRQPAYCEAAGKCGGCTFWNISYPQELEIMQNQMERLFQPVDPEIEVLPIISARPFHYRNKAQFPIQLKDGKIRAGFYKPHTHEIVEQKDCKLQDERINELKNWLIDHLSLKQAAHLRHLFIRRSNYHDQLQLVLIGDQNVDLNALVDELVEAFPDLKSIVFNHNDRKDNVILGDDYEVLYGDDSILERALDLDIRLHFKSFFQVNPQGMDKLYQKAIDLADLSENDRVIDLYSGTGTIGMLAARKAKSVIGVEIVREAVDNANENIRLNGLDNIESVCMDAGEFARNYQEETDVLFVDPPRKGLSTQAIGPIIELSPKKVVYISCNPRTLARDLKVFREKGYKTKVIQPVDMFSHTGNIENIALLEKQDDFTGV